MNSCAAAALAAAITSSRLASGLAKGDVVANGAAEERRLLQYDADLRAQRIHALRRARRGPSMRTRPSVTS